jgi:UDP-N-acetylglucosamine transferase subunit ALG13
MKKKDVLKKRVNLSGRQRMLTQRMTKLALLVHFKINQKENRERLIQYSDLYNQTLLAFKNGDKSTGCIPSKEKDILEQITVIEKEWKPFYKHIKRIIDGKDLDGKSLKYLVDNNEQLLAASNELVKRYEKSDKLKNYLEKARLHVVNVAGRQRMLTQKMTKEKLLIVNGESQYQEKLKKSISLFDSSLKALIQGDPEHHIIKPSNKKIKKQLAVVADMWKKLKPLYENAKPTTKELKTIINENPVLLVEMDKMVKMSEVELDY